MLEADLSGQRYVKSRHGQALVRIGWTHWSVEFKRQNILAILKTLAGEAATVP
jgi:hypothetical protein